MNAQLRVTVWNENVHERENSIVASIYPDGMHNTIADAISEDGDCEVRTATLHDPEHGLTADVLENTDVLVWWGHAAHGKVADDWPAGNGRRSHSWAAPASAKTSDVFFQ